MKTRFLCFLVTVLTLVGSALAVTLPVSEDTATGFYNSWSGQGLLTSRSGSDRKLSLSNNKSAFMRFGVSGMSGDIPEEEVHRALLMIYVTDARRPADLNLHRVTEDWAETVGGSTPQPSFAPNVLATIPKARVIGKQFVLIDVTDQVKKWLDGSDSDFGFALAATDPSTRVEIGSKEGSASGYPAVLQIDRNPVITSNDLPSGIDASKLGAGTVDNMELAFLDGVTSVLQPQLNGLVENINDANTEIEEKVNKSGDTMTGTLQLPEDGLKVGDSQLVAAGGRVGIGTASPAAALEVHGNVKMGPGGDLNATSGEESLRIIRGNILNTPEGPQIVSGSGFTVRRLADPESQLFAHLEITFDRPFADVPTVTQTQQVIRSSFSIAIVEIDAGKVVLRNAGSRDGNGLHFIAIGGR